MAFCPEKHWNYSDFTSCRRDLPYFRWLAPDTLSGGEAGDGTVANSTSLDKSFFGPARRGINASSDKLDFHCSETGGLTFWDSAAALIDILHTLGVCLTKSHWRLRLVYRSGTDTYFAASGVIDPPLRLQAQGELPAP